MESWKQGRDKENSQGDEASWLTLWNRPSKQKYTDWMKKIDDSPEGMSSMAKIRTDRWPNKKEEIV